MFTWHIKRSQRNKMITDPIKFEKIHVNNDAMYKKTALPSSIRRTVQNTAQIVVQKQSNILIMILLKLPFIKQHK